MIVDYNIIMVYLVVVSKGEESKVLRKLTKWVKIYVFVFSSLANR